MLQFWYYTIQNKISKYFMSAIYVDNGMSPHNKMHLIVKPLYKIVIKFLITWEKLCTNHALVIIV